MVVDDVYLHTLDPFAIQFTQTFGIRWYGLAYLAGFLAGYGIIRWLSRRNLSPLPESKVGDFVFSVALGTMIGGRLGYCLFYSPDLFFTVTSSPPFWGVLAVHKGGMASHGGIAGIFITCLIFARRHGLPALHLADLTTLGGTIGIFFGRIANFVNGELPGRPTDPAYPLAVKFPQDILAWPTYAPERLTTLGDVVPLLGISQERWDSLVQGYGRNSATWASLDQTLNRIIESVQRGNQAVAEALAPHLLSRHPSQLYEALLEGLFLFLVLVVFWRKPRKPGTVTALFITAYAGVRIFGEQFRMPDLHIGFDWLGLTRGQLLSVAMLALGVLCAVFWSRRPAPKLGGWMTKVDPSVE